MRNDAELSPTNLKWLYNDFYHIYIILLFKDYICNVNYLKFYEKKSVLYNQSKSM